MDAQRAMRVRVLPPRHRSRAAAAAVWIQVSTQLLPPYYLTRTVPQVLELWASAHAVLCGRPRNAVLAALSMERGGVSTLKDGVNACEGCGLHHLSLLTETMLQEDPPFKKLTKPAPTRNDVTMTSARLRNATFTALFAELAALAETLRTQVALRRTCRDLDSLYTRIVDFLSPECSSIQARSPMAKSQGIDSVGDSLAARCAESGLSAAELLLHMDQETLLPTLNLSLSEEERRQVLALIQSGRNALRREFRVTLKELPDAMDRAVYVLERFPLVLDPSGQATRFLKYQRGAFLMVGNPKDMAPENLRRHLVGALKHGTWLIIDFDALTTVELGQFFTPDSFPREVLSRQALCRPDVYARLLRAEDADPAEFMVNDQFKFVVLCRSAAPPPKTALAMCVLHVEVDGRAAARGESEPPPSGENDLLATALGVAKEVKRNSLEMVEAAFDNDLAVVTKCLDQNYDVDSADGHGHSALSEAACQAHAELLALLLERGADPNKVSDERRSALYRAAYNGHLATVELLLASGADPRIATKQSETAFDVAKTQDVRDALQRWDVATTERLLEQRRKVIEQQWQARITTHVERERYALAKIHEELIALATRGDAEALEARLEQLVDEATDVGEKPRASADVRNEKGATLLALAAQHDHVDVVTLLLTKWRAYKALAAQQHASQASARSRQELLAKVLRANVNARDGRGWTPAAIAVFHEAKRSLRVLLAHGADPTLTNQYNKSAFDLARDDVDAALHVVKSRAEIRQVLLDWENERRVAAVATGGRADPSAAATANDTKSTRGDAKKKKTNATAAAASSSGKRPGGAKSNAGRKKP